MAASSGLVLRLARQQEGHGMLNAQAVLHNRSAEALHPEQPAQSPYADRIPPFHQLSFLTVPASAPKPYLHCSATPEFQPLSSRASMPVPRSHSAPLQFIPPHYSHLLDASPAAACGAQSNPVDLAAQSADTKE